IEQGHVDAVLADAPPPDQLSDWRNRHDRTTVVVLVDDEEDGVEALAAGAGAILPRTAARDEIAIAIKAVGNGLAVVPRALLAALLEDAPPTGSLPDAAGARLT